MGHVARQRRPHRGPPEAPGGSRGARARGGWPRPPPGGRRVATATDRRRDSRLETRSQGRRRDASSAAASRRRRRAARRRSHVDTKWSGGAFPLRALRKNLTHIKNQMNNYQKYQSIYFFTTSGEHFIGLK